MLWLGIVGPNGSGKTTVCQYLSNKGFAVFSLSDEVRKENQKQGRPMDRDHLIQTANQLKQQQGTNILAVRCMSFVGQKSLSHVVFDSIRHESEVKYLKDKGVLVIGIQVSVDERFQRIQSRGNDTDQVNMETFKRQDQVERLGDSFGQNIDQCLTHCSVVLDNDGDIDELYEKVDQILASHQGGVHAN